MDSRLKVDNLSWAVEGRSILCNLNIDVHARRIGIVGRNGSGKSSLARLLAGLVSPTSGRIQLNGIDPARNRKAALREVGILFQNPDHQIIFPSVIEEVAFGLTQLGHSRKDANTRAEAALREFGVPHWRDVQVATLSQGQKHLVCLIAVAAMTPKIMLLDEPFAGLDIPTKAQLGRYLDRYAGSLVHISHDPKDLQGYDAVLWIDAGTVRQSGSAQAVLQAYENAMIEAGGKDDLANLSD